MRHRHKLLFLFPLFYGCVSKNPVFNEAEAILKEAKVLLSDIENIQDITLDQNLDGIADVYYEDYALTYIQFIDRNFDGRADEKYEYDSNTDFLLDGRQDNDFNGIFETHLVHFQGVLQFEFVDSNNDKFIDIVSSYKHGVLSEVQRYIQVNGEEQNRIESNGFKFGVPQGTETKPTKLSVTEFHEEQAKKIKTQEMYPRKDGA